MKGIGIVIGFITSIVGIVIGLFTGLILWSLGYDSGRTDVEKNKSYNRYCK